MKAIFEIQDEINSHVIYTRDYADHWQTYRESMERGLGDCEDIAIAKYFLAIESGFDTVDLTIVYCLCEIGPHMVLRYKDTILDNRRGDIVECKNSDLTPVYGFNTDSSYLINEDWIMIPIKMPLKKWEEVLARTI